ncbi:hypothetical protein MNBD_GAMMA14-1132 [hydrothermal vent metagenome]|uniref:Thioredoxin-like fold domain-containing protein n=1 Tax=hydrothermal vent metagenome TaxID=652676 RepID=A0A3B0YRL0_9ZZZZ
MSIKVEVFSSPGCSKCGHAEEVLRKLADELGGDKIEWRGVNILDEIDYAVELGVLSTPAIAIDGELVFSGLPSMRKLRAALETRLGIPPGQAQS